MKKEDIKKHLSCYSIYNKRKTTINHAFASAIAPIDIYDEIRTKDALSYLGQNPNGNLQCIYCQEKAQTWDHLIGLVKNNELRGYGHQLGNLVPCCKECNSKKGGKDYKIFINECDKIENKQELIELLSLYQKKFTFEINFNNLKSLEEYKKFDSIKKEIFDLMEKADLLAKNIRKKLLK